MDKKWKRWQILYSWAPKSLHMVTAAMKLKDTCSLEEKLWPNRQHIKKQRHYFADKGPYSQSHDFPVVMYGCESWTIKKAVVVQSLRHVQFFVTPWTLAHQASLSITISQGLLKLLSTKLVMPSNHLIFCHPLLLLPSFFPSIRVFSSESALCIRWPKYWSISFNIRLSEVEIARQSV